MKKKVYPIIYSKKMSNVLEDMSFGGNKYNILDGEKKSGYIIAKEALSNDVLEHIESLKTESQKHFEPFEKFVK
jgi:polysaccharide pyruvyl transferase WcaK-like protein